jgi:hypothetical protein
MHYVLFAWLHLRCGKVVCLFIYLNCSQAFFKYSGDAFSFNADIHCNSVLHNPPPLQGNTKLDSSGSEPVVYFAPDASEKGSVSLHHENSLVRSLPLLPIEIALLL